MMKILNLALSVVNIFLFAAIIVKSWSWFVAPLGIPELKNYAHALGLSCIASFFNGSIGLTLRLLRIDDSLDDYYASKLFFAYVVGFVFILIVKLFY